MTPDPCYHIENVLVDGVPDAAAIASGTYTFNNVGGNHTISVSFAANGNYTITTMAGANGNIDASSSVACGSDATVNITPDACYHVATLVVDGNAVTPATTVNFTNVTENHTVDVTFAINTYTINTTAGTGGSIDASQTVNCGANATIHITPDPCHHIATLTVDGNAVAPPL